MCSIPVFQAKLFHSSIILNLEKQTIENERIDDSKIENSIARIKAICPAQQEVQKNGFALSMESWRQQCSAFRVGFLKSRI